MTPGMTQIWLRPTRASPACRYSYPDESKLTNGRLLFSDCGVWKTNFEKDIIVAAPGSDMCPHCAVGSRVNVMKDVPVMKPRPPKRREMLRFLHRNA